MRAFIGKYNRNRKIIWLIIGVIVAILCLIHIANNKIKLQESLLANNDNITVNKQFYDTNYSVISSEKINISTSNSVTDIIKQFITYCNEGDFESAYNILSQDCKEVLYPTLEDFRTNYYNNNFNERKTYNLQSWITYNNKFIYMIELEEDILSTGKTSNVKKQDYYTVIKENDNYYLNIAGFIEKNSINTSKIINSIEFTIESEEVFIDYLNLNIKVNNQAKSKVLLDSGKKGDTVFVTDSEGIEYVSYLFENNNSDLIIPTNCTRNFKIKFMKNYQEKRPIKTVVFEDIVLNYEKENNAVLNIIIEL